MSGRSSRRGNFGGGGTDWFADGGMLDRIVIACINALIAGALSYTNHFCFYSVAAGSIVLSQSRVSFHSNPLFAQLTPASP